MTMPFWLPHKVNVDGQWERILGMLYAVFTQDFKASTPVFEGVMISWDERILDGEYEEGFWHLITKQDYQQGDRLFDPPRATKLPWCAPVINNASDSEVKAWDYQEKPGRVRIYLWLMHWDYVVILEKKLFRGTGSVFLVTAYHVGGDATRKKLQQKYEQRII